MKSKQWGGASRRFFLLGVMALATALTGCGGSSGGGNSQSVSHVRGYNAVPDSTTAIIKVGSNTLPGSVTSSNGTVTTGQGFLQASSYTSQPISTASVTFTLTSNSAVSYPAVSQALAGGTYYSAFVFGRAGITSAADPRYPQIQVSVDDRTAPPVGDARLRLVHAAPDAGNVDVVLDGQTVASNIAYKSVGDYLNVVAGDRTIQINKAGTSTALVPATTVTVSAGQLYSILVVEPFLIPSPTFSLQPQSDAS